MNLGFFGLLTLLLVILKAFGMFSFSWWVVFAPFIIATVVTVFVFIILVLLAFAAAIAADKVK